MGRRTTFLAGTMIFWLPVLFMMTYVGFYEAYRGAMNSEFLGLDYPQEFATLLIIPAMIPTMFTAHTILNREKMTLKLIEKFNFFHSRVEDGRSEGLEETLLTKREYGQLDYVTQIEYCRDLRDVGKSTLANNYLKQYYTDYINSNNSDERAAAHYSKTLITDGSVTQKEMYESSEKAYQLIADRPESRIYQKLVYAHVVELSYIGYENGLRRIREIEATLSDNYLLILVDIRKLYFLYRMDKISNIDFDSIEKKIDYTAFDKSQLDRLESGISKIKNEIMLDNGDFKQLELFLQNREYRYKWNGKTTEHLLNNLGRMYRKKGDYKNALRCFNENLTRGRSKNIPMDEGVSLVNLGKTRLLMEDYAEVKKLCKQSLEVFTELDMARGLIESLTLIVRAKDALGEDSTDASQRLKKLELEHGIIAQTN